MKFLMYIENISIKKMYIYIYKNIHIYNEKKIIYKKQKKQIKII
jgi:hypothetical protein